MPPRLSYAVKSHAPPSFHVGRLLATTLACTILVATSFADATPWHSLFDNVQNSVHGAEMALYIPWPVFTSSLVKVLQTFTTVDQETLADQTITVNGLNWQLSGIGSNVNSGFSVSQPSANSFPIQSKNLSIGVSIQRLAIDQIVAKTVGSATVNVHVQAVCGPLLLKQISAQAQANIIYLFSDTALKTTVSQFNLAWPNKSWDVGTVSCQGPNGLDQELKNALIQQLQSADSFKALIQDKLAAKIQDEVDTVLSSLKTPTSVPVNGNPLPLRLSFSRFAAGKSGLMIFGKLDWSESGAAIDVRPLVLTGVPPELQNSTSPQLITLNHSWEDVLEAELVAYNRDTPFDLNAEPSFQSLLESRVKQFFVWPDLYNYNGQSKFVFLLHTPQVQNISWQADGSAQALVTSSGWIQSQRSSPNTTDDTLKTWNYVALNGKGQAKIEPSISHGQLTFTAVASGTDLHAQFGDEYVKTFAPDTYLAPTLLKQLKATLETPLTQHIPLPALSMGPLGDAKLNGWNSIANGLLAMPVEF